MTVPILDKMMSIVHSASLEISRGGKVPYIASIIAILLYFLLVIIILYYYHNNHLNYCHYYFISITLVHLLSS